MCGEDDVTVCLCVCVGGGGWCSGELFRDVHSRHYRMCF